VILTVVVIVEALVIVALAVLVLGLLRSHAGILRRLHALDGGDPDGTGVAATATSGGQPFQTVPEIPGPGPVRIADPKAAARDIVGQGLTDDSVVIRTAGVDHDTVLAFLSTGCLTCQGFWSDFASPDGVLLPARTRLVVVTKDLAEESPAVLAELAPPGIDVVLSSQAWADYDVPGSPYVVAVDGATGRVQGEGTGMSWEQVAGLLAQATGDRAYLVADTSGRPVKPESDVEREARVDRELLAAGVLPGDPSLYPDGEPPAHASGHGETP
jgi:hypothetical protein